MESHLNLMILPSGVYTINYPYMSYVTQYPDFSSLSI